MEKETILIGDSGSTFTRWAILDYSGLLQHCFVSRGFNPSIYNKEELLVLLRTELSGYQKSVTAVRFYGAGCTKTKSAEVKEIFRRFFLIDDIRVYSDLMAVVHSLSQDSECIAAILGTGSNSCYYNGTEIQEQVPALGYILGDEGSGAVMGRKLLGDVLKNRLSEQLIRDFYQTYSLDQYKIIEEVYRGSAPNRYLASFVPFIKKHISDGDMQQLVEHSFSEFVERNLLYYSRAQSLPVYISGGIACNFEEQLRKVFNRYGLLLEQIAPDPMDGLIKYYQNTITQ